MSAQKTLPPPLTRGIAPLLVLLLTLAGCAVNPVTGRNELSLISESQEIAIGNEQYSPSQQTQGGLYRVDPEITAYVSEVGGRLAKVSDRQLPYEFVVLNESTPNAWALPGGKIAVNRGLLTSLRNEAELAAVLGHEIVHSAARHGAKAMQRGLLAQGAVLLTGLAAEESEYKNYIVGAAQLSAQLLGLRYDRSAELESDYYGIEYMVRAGYDPEAAVSLQESFLARADEADSGWLAGLFASHPPSKERVLSNRDTVDTMEQRKDLRLGTQTYTQRLAYLRSVAPAYDAFDRARFLMQENQLDSAISALEKAVKLEPREARFYGAMGDIYLQQNRYQQANEAYNRAVSLDPEYYAHYLGRGVAHSRTGQTAAAQNDLARSNQLLPTAVAMNELGHLSLQSGRRDEAKRYYQSAMSAHGELGQTARTAFVRLDITDNPGSYIGLRPQVSNERLVAELHNNSDLPLSTVDVHFSALINGERRSRTVRVRNLRDQGIASPGWKVSQEDSVSELSVAVTRVVL